MWITFEPLLRQSTNSHCKSTWTGVCMICVHAAKAGMSASRIVLLLTFYRKEVINQPAGKRTNLLAGPAGETVWTACSLLCFLCIANLESYHFRFQITDFRFFCVLAPLR